MTFLDNLLNVCREMYLQWINMGIALGLTLGVIILLRPVTNRVLRPVHRFWLWSVAWMAGIFSRWYEILGGFRILPVTLRELIVPRTEGRGSLIPAYFPYELRAGEDYSIVLPGGTEIPLGVEAWALDVLTVVSVAAVFWFFWFCFFAGKRLDTRGRRMSREELLELGADDTTIAVRLCEGLPTSYVRTGHDTGKKDGISYVVYLQAGLPPERLELVLQHELSHIYGGHLVTKKALCLALVLFFWNPVVWLAHRLTCRDMELACDERVLEKLSPEERREYARTLVDLASGKHMWGNMTCFGECDAAIRVRRVANWKESTERGDLLRIIVWVLLFLFLFTGKSDDFKEYVLSPAMTLDLRESVGDGGLELQEIWIRSGSVNLDGGQAMVLDREGTWYRCYFYQWRDDAGRHSELAAVETLEDVPDLSNYVKIAAYRE